jgi:tRNA nucleotidyltransferase (CCA-adding enzyme)
MKKEMNVLLEGLRSDRRQTVKEHAALKKIVREFLAKFNKSLKKSKVKAQAVIGGSGAKGTWLKGLHDIDVFACFDYNKHKNNSFEISELLEKAVKKTSNTYDRLHGSRDYFKIEHQNYSFEIVPILRIKKASQAKNITDASLLHAEWVNVKIKTHKKARLDDEIRLTKSFCIAQRVYGAESYVRGFSGYACELLTIYYGSFLKLATEAVKWKKLIADGKKIVIDVEKHYRRKDPLRELNEAKVQSGLVVIDPVQHDRNATAALSDETLLDFIGGAEKFLKKPSADFFEKEEITKPKLMKQAKGNKLVLIKVKPSRGKEDIVGAKLIKAHNHIKQILVENSFEVIDDGWDWGKNHKGDALFWYFVDKKVPKPDVRDGPPVSNKFHADKFKKAHTKKKDRKVFEKKGRLYVTINRKYTKSEQLVKVIIKEDKYLKEKAAKYTI